MIKKTFKNYFDLIFQNYTIIDNKEYRLPYYIYIPKTILNFIYLFGGFLLVSSSFSMFLQSINIQPNLLTVVTSIILIPLIVNYLIVYLSPLVEVKEDDKKSKYK
ncbi:hypothetical protein [Arcobacter vandammei]|uniref:hypothetical protein n=1 Tax=Arcobacter vandammei TaxID=2782243 RepID=UPI00211D9EC3|nr:hypothetical protein [Arcobacter vandammei]